MFSNLSNRLTDTFRKLSGKGSLTESNIEEGINQVRRALLEADVAKSIVDTFLVDIRQKALGQNILKSLDPAQVFTKVVHDELVHIMGDFNEKLNLAAQPPVVILMAGLQGSGKTTTTAKLARWLKEEQNKKVMVTSTDIYRPAAIEQLKTLAQQIDVSYFPSTVKDRPVAIAKAAIKDAKKSMMDVVIIDTAGRLHIDEQMMEEITALEKSVNPTEVLFVVDSMTGQDAANTAKEFHEKLSLTGVILTKTDGDARGGAALSVRQITGKPIKFMGIGEKIDALEPFHPDRVASRILGMGDVLTLVEDVERAHRDEETRKKTEKIAKKFKKGQFDFEDFLTQLKQMRDMGGMASLLAKLPGGANLPPAVKDSLDEKLFIRMEAMIQSMTPDERHFPAKIRGSRKKRIADGSGTAVSDVNQLIKRFTQMQKMMKKMKGKGMANMMSKMPKGFPGGGQLPPFN